MNRDEFERLAKTAIIGDYLPLMMTQFDLIQQEHETLRDRVSNLELHLTATVILLELLRIDTYAGDCLTDQQKSVYHHIVRSAREVLNAQK